ncbi:hypothetical protein MHYP_G00031080 [Metynnis hypsauchen]
MYNFRYIFFSSATVSPQRSHSGGKLPPRCHQSTMKRYTTYHAVPVEIICCLEHKAAGQDLHQMSLMQTF